MLVTSIKRWHRSPKQSGGVLFSEAQRINETRLQKEHLLLKKRKKKKRRKEGKNQPTATKKEMLRSPNRSVPRMLCVSLNGGLRENKVPGFGSSPRLFTVHTLTVLCANENQSTC